ncbi:MAG TPA: peptidoglycan-binding domain-containing protein [Stellaceae bacterium]|nr:peptidoglycan-binding domain-containing protein [Stellaceae bacterium]
MYKGIIAVVALGALTAACGSDTQQRSASGGLTGLGVGALVGGPVGAIVGGAVGAAGGWAMPEGADTLALNAVHKEKTAASGALSDVGLASSGSSQASQGHLVRDAQRELQREGLYRGPLDGVLGPETKQAIAAYQAREGLQQTATLDQDTVERMNLAPGLDRTAARDHATAGSGGSTPRLSADDVRDRLQSAGYSNVSNVRQQGQRYTARAERGNDTYTLRVDGRTGKVISEQRVASTEGQGSSVVAPASTSTSTETNPGGAAPSR